MTGICGWIGSGDEQRGDAEALAGMAIALDAVGSSPATATERIGSVAARVGTVPAEVGRFDSLVVAVQGRFRWETQELESLARDRGSSAAVAELYRRHGADCLQHVHGPFALAIVDEAEASGLLAVDRMGIRTMCFASPERRLVFGSTAESVAAHPAVGRRVSAQAIFDYLYCHVVPSPRTIFEGVQKLQPAECVVFRDGRVDRRFYWQLRYVDEGDVREAAFDERFRTLLRDATRRTIEDDHDIGAFLSGGTDSSTVAGLLTELRGKPAKTYSIGFAAEGFDEMAYARIASKHFGTTAHEYYLTPADVVEAIPVIAAVYDEPFGNESAVPAYFCARMARSDGVRVMLAGDGGDEIFGGNARYAKQRVFEAYQRIPASLRQTIIEPIAMRSAAGDRISPVRKARSYVRQASVPLPDRLESYNFLHRSPLAEIFEPQFLASIDPTEPRAILGSTYRRAESDSYINRMMHLDLTSTLADNDLRKVCRMCDTAGVEVRYPLLDEALVEFSGELPASLKVKGLELRYFFKRALRGFLPQEVIAKTKHGFGMPFGLWLKDHAPLADLAQDSLQSFGGRGIIRRDYLDAVSRQQETGNATYYGTMIWVTMMLERWLQARRA
jgi:asparagine synthase (glutamine-hydrolysing)